jgi:BlaI family transcriptional regulator, penicillinase repressor
MKRELNAIILTRQELQIMKIVWDLGSATVKEVCGSISRQKKTAYTTVLTLMGILEDKGALEHQRCGRAYNYRPLLTREQATKNHVMDLVNRLFDGNSEQLIKTIREIEPQESVPVGASSERIRAREMHQSA